MTDQDYIKQHRDEDVRQLALRPFPDGVDRCFVLEQIAGWQRARQKLPHWAATEGIVYPPSLSMEQCSSEQTALYKLQICSRLLLPMNIENVENVAPLAPLLIDFTGGFGVDFSYMARPFGKALYIERQEVLCRAARNNFPLLGLRNAEIINSEAETALLDLENRPLEMPGSRKTDTPSPQSPTILYLDPARRDSNGTRIYAISDCTPDVVALMPRLLRVADHIILKLSPMLDWRAAASELEAVLTARGADIADSIAKISEIHIVSVANECKELLIVISKKIPMKSMKNEDAPPETAVSQDEARKCRIYCANDDDSFCCDSDFPTAVSVFQGASDTLPGQYLYVPNASIMKCGCFVPVQRKYPSEALAHNSHLFVSSCFYEDYPGRCFVIESVCGMGKKELKTAFGQLKKANVAVRNFPLTAKELQKRLKLADGGSIFLFGTTDNAGNHIILKTEKQNNFHLKQNHIENQ